MKHEQRGFAAQGALVLLVIVAVVIGSGYLVMSRQNKQNDSVETTEKSSEIKKLDVPVDGTPKSAVNEIANQVTQEIQVDDSSFKEEENDEKIDDSMNTEIEGALHEKNL